MIAITTYSVTQAIAFTVDILLVSAVILFGTARLKKPFIIFLLSAAVWSFFSFMSNQSIPFEQAVFWGRFVAFFAIIQAVLYAYFVTTYVGNKKATRYVISLGIVLAIVVGVLVASGHIPQNFLPQENGIVFKEYGSMMLLLGPAGITFLIISLALLIKHYRGVRNPEEKNRTAYLLLGISLLLAFGVFYTVRPMHEYTTDQVGHLANALAITYAVIRYRLIGLKLFFRKSMVYTGITASLVSTFALLFFILNYLAETSLPAPARIAIAAVVVLIMARVFNPLRIALERVAERLFYGNKYDYRQMVLNFASRMSNVIDMEQLADSMLRPIAQAVSAKQVSLLIANHHHFNSHFAERLVKEEPVAPISLRMDGPIVAYLKAGCTPLLIEEINSNPEFKGMWQEERNALDAAEVELILPVKSKQKLIAILALSKKHPRGYYSQDDIDMLMTLAHEAAVVIENAQLYEKAKQRANTDELTELFNHRYFHQRIEEEIARCSRFGETFSLIFMDLDIFKNYNDVYGHQAGDEVLKQFGRIINGSIRKVDIGFRYGGDEFAVILPGSSFDDALIVASRIRKGLEAQTDMKGIPQTCSIGIASWPTDGMMREEIIQSADAALYYAKQTGGNQECLASQVVLSDALRINAEEKTLHPNAILSTIYALAATVDAKDHYTYGHSKKVSKYATLISEVLGYSKDGIDRIRAAALLHDIGKIGIADNILQKREPLTKEEWEQIRTHPSLGISILKHVNSLQHCLAAVQYHHERYDGTGYPAGLKGDNIPLDARILALADSYDAMTSHRPYRDYTTTKEQALEELKRCSGTQFDPAVVEVFVNLQEKALQAIENDEQEIGLKLS